ncbi:MAG: signal recognition particle protein Srp19 [ANME-2 cluster archaeon]|nr:signal recognition particle protein Srp19 [ANME-2 cluster archaeon]
MNDITGAMLRDRDKYVIWPDYIDKGNSRSSGRIIPRKLSVTSPELKEIEQAAKEMGLNPVVEKGKAYPRSWWEVSGRVLVDKKGVKSGIAREIARKIAQMRG